jgi:DNA-binding beta-propeller fold protein YncE
METGQASNLTDTAPLSQIAGNSMRIRLRKSLALASLLVGGPAALLLFPQLGGNIAPLRIVQDPYPVFADIAVDPDSNIVAVADENKFSLRTYDRDLVTGEVADPRTVVSGVKSGIDFICGVAIDDVNKQIYTANNDTGADLMIFNYGRHGDVPPDRVISPAATGTWGVALDLIHDEVAVTIQHENKIAVYRRLATRDDKPLRIIQGPGTGLADPHGLAIDAENDEIFVANHDSYHEVMTGEQNPNAVTADIARGTATAEALRGVRVQLRPSRGRFVEPSVTVYSRDAANDAVPLRVIRGPKTELSLPMKIFVDTLHNEIFVANSGTSAILVFSRTANGDVAPIRKLQGPDTGLKKPVGLFVDLKNDELWATNPELHTATVYRRTAEGNTRPLRTLKSAPDGAPAPGIGNPGGIAYDPLRQQILVPN